tara:strand:- start:576 stop:1028 length:453 start_codon:yes stop_codon:yes gene_type:complete
MLDKGFFKILIKELPMRYRKYIFNPPSGRAAKNVYGREYPAYSTKYGIAKKTGQMKRQASSFANSTAPVLSGDLLKDFVATNSGLLSDGMGFGNITELGKVKNLEKQGRAIATSDRPLPKPVEKWIMGEADRYSKEWWKKNAPKGRRWDI